MRRFFLFLLVAVFAVFLSSCLTIEERLTVKADGSGTQVTTVDLAKMFENPFMKMAMEEAAKEEGGGETAEVVDSSFLVYAEFLEVNPGWTAEERALALRAQGHILMDFDGGEGYIRTTFPFDDLSDINDLSELLARSNQPAEKEEGGPGGMMSGLSGGDFATGSLMLKGKKFVRTSTISPSFENPFENEELGEEGAEMMKDMFSDAVILYVMEFPGKVKKVKGFQGHEVDGNEVIQAFDFLDLVEHPEVINAGLSGQIKFKN